MKTHRRTILKGLGGFSLALPFLEGLRSTSTARAGEAPVEPYAIFFRQANGVASAQGTDVGDEPERFWPRQQGELTPESLTGRALDELVTGWPARIVQHETDHLDGVLYVDRAELRSLVADSGIGAALAAEPSPTTAARVLGFDVG